MWMTIRQTALVGLFVLAGLGGAALARAATPQGDARAALSAMRDWLATDSGGAKWNKFLKSQELDAELAKGAAADKAVVKEILDLYAGTTAGLDRRQFAAVRTALQAWLTEISLPKAEELPGAARAAASQYAPVDTGRVEKAKTKLNSALATLEQWLARSGEKTNTGWKSYLVWNDLQAQLVDGGSPDPKALELAISKFRANEIGLELNRFTAVRDALREYATSLEYSSEDKLKEAFPKQLEELAARLEAFASGGAGEELTAAGRIVGWLEQAGQTPELVKGVRHNYRSPNLFAQVSSDLVSAAVADDVNDTAPVREYILKTQIQGTAHTRGQISAGLIPSTSRATLEVVLLGNSYTNNVGYQGPVTIYSTGNTRIHARKQLYLDADGLKSAPAGASCATATSINGIDAPLRIIEKMAWRKAGQKKSQAEAIASGKAQARVAAQMDRRVAELVTKSNETYGDKFKKPLLRRGEFPRHIDIASTTDQMTILVQQMNPMQLAAPAAPPALDGRHDMSVRVHETAVSNFAESAIGGETLTDKRLADMMQEATGNVPEELQLSPDKDPWSITFHSVRPVSARFSGQEVKIAIRGQRFTRGENAIKEPMEISAAYKIERTGNGVKFVRQGEVVADYVEKHARLSVTQVAFKTFMRRKFSALFKEEIDRGRDGLVLPGRMEKVGPLPLDVISADGGWLVAAWKLPGKTRTAQAK